MKFSRSPSGCDPSTNCLHTSSQSVCTPPVRSTQSVWFPPVKVSALLQSTKCPHTSSQSVNTPLVKMSAHLQSKCLHSSSQQSVCTPPVNKVSAHLQSTAARAALPIPISVCSISVCPNNGMVASVQDC